jgi:Ca2+-binding RTX toxin-like protein
VPEALTFSANGVTLYAVNVTGGGGADSLTGSTLADTLSGGAGDDILDGGTGNDILLGGAGDDILDGGTGNDSIEGGVGIDVLTGDLGADNFVITSRDTANRDIITDFTVGVGGDTLQFDISDLELAGSDVFLGAAHQLDATGSQEIVVLNFASYASDAEAAAAVAATVTTDGLSMVIIYHNNSDLNAANHEVRVIHVTNSNTGTGVSLIATLNEGVANGDLDELTELAAAVAGNFGGRP